jgi:hypothetical protein
MHTARNYRNAEREFLDSVRGPVAGGCPIDRARATQRAIDESRPLRIPVADAHEVPLEDLTPTERNSFFGAFDDTVVQVQP